MRQSRGFDKFACLYVYSEEGGLISACSYVLGGHLVWGPHGTGWRGGLVFESMPARCNGTVGRRGERQFWTSFYLFIYFYLFIG